MSPASVDNALAQEKRLQLFSRLNDMQIHINKDGEWQRAALIAFPLLLLFLLFLWLPAGLAINI